MAEKRTFTSSVCVKTGAKTAFKIELFPAEQWPESAQDCAGRFRLRINRRWHDLPEGGMAFLDLSQVGELAAAMLGGKAPELEPEPDMPRATAVSVPTGKMLDGVKITEGTRTATPPIRAYNGRWHVGVTMFGKGTVFVPVSELRRKG